jgi:hypothetical protein
MRVSMCLSLSAAALVNVADLLASQRGGRLRCGDRRRPALGSHDGARDQATCAGAGCGGATVIGCHVTVIDYGIGNLLNVVRALEHCGATRASGRAGDAGQHPAGPAGTARCRCFRGCHEPNCACGALMSWSSAMSRPAARFSASAWARNCCLKWARSMVSTLGLGLIPWPCPTRAQRSTLRGSRCVCRTSAGAAWCVRPRVRRGTALSWRRFNPARPCTSCIPMRRCPRMKHTAWRIPTTTGSASARPWRATTIYGCQFHPERSAEVGLGILGYSSSLL